MEEIKHEEDAIIVPYKTWFQKYKPMEDRINELLYALKYEKEKKRIELELSVHSTYSEYSQNIGYIDIVPVKGMPNDPRYDAIKIDLVGEAYIMLSRARVIDMINTIGMGGRNHLSKAQAEKYTKEVEQLILRKIAIQTQNDRNIAGIPKFIKWLFNIKNI